MTFRDSLWRGGEGHAIAGGADGGTRELAAGGRLALDGLAPGGLVLGARGVERDRGAAGDAELEGGGADAGGGADDVDGPAAAGEAVASAIEELGEVAIDRVARAEAGLHHPDRLAVVVGREGDRDQLAAAPGGVGAPAARDRHGHDDIAELERHELRGGVDGRPPRAVRRPVVATRQQQAADREE